MLLKIGIFKVVAVAGDTRPPEGLLQNQVSVALPMVWG